MGASEKVAVGSQSRYFTLATAGHVDHGKTSLLKALTGIDPDRLKEEKERGMTTDLGFAHMRLPDGLVVGFIDVPGHGKFLKNMLAGVGGIELALLVVAADEGPMPQTYEHARILSLLGIKSVLVALTKNDLVDDRQTTAVAAQVETLLAGESISLMGLVPISCTQGTGIGRLKEVLVESLNRMPAESTAGAAFLPVDRVFNKPGFGTIVTGTLVRGELTTGSEICIEPGGMKARIRRLETFGQVLERARAGQRLALNLVVKDGGGIARGHVLLGEPLAPTTLILVQLAGLPERISAGELAALAGQPIRLYHGTAEYHGRVRWVELLADPVASERGCGPLALAALAMSDPVVAEAGHRFVIRLSDDTIYGGRILMRDQPRWLARAKLKELARQILDGDYQAAAVSYVSSSPQGMVPEGQLGRLLPAAVRAGIAGNIIAAGDLVRLANYLLPKAVRQELEDRAVAAVAARAGKASDLSGTALVPLEQLKASVMPAADRTVFQQIVQAAVEGGKLARHGDKVTLPGAAQAAANPDREALAQAVVCVLAENLCLEIDEIARRLARPPREVKSVIERLAETSQATVVNYEFASSAATIRKAHEILARLWSEKQQISPSDFKEALGVTRKYAMALLAHFDDLKITRRVGEGRALLVQPPKA